MAKVTTDIRLDVQEQQVPLHLFPVSKMPRATCSTWTEGGDDYFNLVLLESRMMPHLLLAAIGWETGQGRSTCVVSHRTCFDEASIYLSGCHK